MTIDKRHLHMLILVVVATMSTLTSTASAQLKIVAYNCKHNPTSSGNTYWTTQLANYGNATWHNTYYGSTGYGTIPKRPAVMALTECGTSLQGEADTVSQVVAILNAIYGSQGGTYASTQIHAGSYEDYALVYDSSQVTLLESRTVAGGTRPFLRGRFRPVGYTTSASEFYLYVVHLKAYPDYEQTRLSEVNAMLFRSSGAADELPANSNIIYLGDFNFTTSYGEPAYDLLLNPSPDGVNNPGVAFDPLGDICSPAYGGNTPAAYSTYSATSPWSRIDFQFPSLALHDHKGMDYIDSVNGLDSLHAHGNRNGSTSGYQAVQSASDHLPLIADYQLPAKMSVSTTMPSSAVIVGATTKATVVVTNTAPATVVAGADKLDYSISGTGVVTGSASGSDAALGTGNTHSIALNTATPGVRTGQINVVSTSQAAENASVSTPVTQQILAHSEASVVSGSNIDTLTIDLGRRVPNSGTVSTTFSIYNRVAVAGYTASLDIDGVSGSGDIDVLKTDVAAGAAIPAGGSQKYHATLTTTRPGNFSSTWTINVSDQNFPGATSGTPLKIILTGRVAMSGDVNMDGIVDGSDLNLLLSHYDEPGSWAEGDFNGDGIVDGSDLNLLLTAYME